MPNTALKIKNIPDGLEDYLLEYAKHSARLDKDPDDVYWAETFLAEFLVWPDSPERWAGAWGGTSVFVILEDHSRRYPAPKTAELQRLEHQMHAETSVYSLPVNYQSKYLKTVVLNGKQCSSSKLTHADIKELKASMSKEELAAWQSSIDEEIRCLNHDRDAYATFEKPIRVHLMGTDDTSYSLCFETREDAMEAFDVLKKSPSWETLNNMGFFFTN
jgi:hypothetical protein